MVSSFSWLGCRPVTAEITGSSPVGTAVSLVVYIGVNTPMIEGVVVGSNPIRTANGVLSVQEYELGCHPSKTRGSLPLCTAKKLEIEKRTLQLVVE